MRVVCDDCLYCLDQDAMTILVSSQFNLELNLVTTLSPLLLTRCFQGALVSHTSREGDVALAILVWVASEATQSKHRFLLIHL